MAKYFATFVFWSLTTLAAWAHPVNNADKQGLMLSGYDPVSYFKGSTPVKGDPKIQTRQGDLLYYFANEENKKTFVADPEKYKPQFGGWCAYAVADSKSKVEVDPKSFLIQDGKLLLFYNGLWGDTKSKWTTDKKKSTQEYLAEAEKNWPDVKNKEP